MTEASITPDTVKPSRFQLLKNKVSTLFNSGKEKVISFFDRATVFKNNLVEKVTDTYNQVVEKAQPILQRIEASKLHETAERFRGHVDTLRGVVGQIRLNTLYAESNNEDLSEEKKPN